MKDEVVNEKRTFVYTEEKQLTVLKTSRFFPGDGFVVYDSNGEIIFRVDSYGPNNRDNGQLVLMDPYGHCLITVQRKRRSLHQRWDGFSGERSDGQKPIFSVRRSSIIGRSSVTVQVYTNPSAEYQIEGSFSQRCCTIFNKERKRVAEIRRKVDTWANVVLGKDVFSLYLEPGFDAAFAMGLVLVLDRINGGDDCYVDHRGVRVGPHNDNTLISP